MGNNLYVERLNSPKKSGSSFNSAVVALQPIVRTPYSRIVSIFVEDDI